MDQAAQHFAIMEQMLAALQHLCDVVPAGYIQAPALAKLRADLAAHKAAVMAPRASAPEEPSVKTSNVRQRARSAS